MKQYKILVIGSGGTGGYFLKEATRYIAHLPSEKKNLICDLLIADGDILENKNLSRQSFSKSDVGRYKSSCMADLLNTLFEDAKQKMMWRAYTKYIVTISEYGSLEMMNVPNIYPIGNMELLKSIVNHNNDDEFIDIKDLIKLIYKV